MDGWFWFGVVEVAAVGVALLVQWRKERRR